ncbi:MAG: DUF6514 family protein [Oscillospiraceae bacterium]|jgi:hypothetical protein|nr:DUF6514 family protein [Oscillospiraceae bacterium]
MILKSICTKEFSFIPSLQNRREIDYAICEFESEGGRVYGINISETDHKGSRAEDTVREVSRDKTKVEDLIKFLSENAIGLSHLRDVIKDLDLKFTSSSRLI